MRIGKVAELASTAPGTIRYYESLGVLSTPSRSPSGYRAYSDSVIEELRFIKKAQALGFSLEETREILALSRSGTAPCSHVLSLSQRHLAAVEERIRRLEVFRDRLAAGIERWRDTKPSCDGLCQIIAAAAVEDSPISVSALTPRRVSRAPRK